jgi:hypothetical protein
MNKTIPLILSAVMFLTSSTCDKRNRPTTMSDPRVDIKLNTDQAAAVLAILDDASSGQAPDSAMWGRLFSCEPYVRLKQREHEIADRFNVPELRFTDGDFRTFVLSQGLARRAPGLAATLKEWETCDLAAAGRRVLAYLPAGARIRAKFFPVIKPFPNSFVYEMGTDPTMFLYLDPDGTRAEFENTVAHEMHHIGLASIDSSIERAQADAPPAARPALQWLGAFGEGFAMLAAAGGPDVHPHAASPAGDRARWDSAMANVDQDLTEIDTFLSDILQGRLKADDEIARRGSVFYGTAQGPWYTVGYQMSVTVERKFGRDRLIACMLDPRLLLHDYNLAAAEHNRTSKGQPALWSPQLLEGLGVGDAKD